MQIWAIANEIQPRRIIENPAFEDNILTRRVAPDLTGFRGDVLVSLRRDPPARKDAHSEEHNMQRHNQRNTTCRSDAKQ